MIEKYFDELKAIAAANKIQAAVYDLPSGKLTPKVKLMRMPHSTGGKPHSLCCQSVSTKVITDGDLSEDCLEITGATFAMVVEVRGRGLSRISELHLWQNANEQEVRDAISLQSPFMEDVKGRYSQEPQQATA